MFVREKRGFTLIEIIICIVLLGVIGATSVVVVKNSSNNKVDKVLVENESDFEDALQVYLSNHPEIIANVNDNVKAAVVSLELLKNEGLIKDGLDIDYKNNYYTLTNAVLLEDPAGVTEETIENECANQVEIKTFASWNIDEDSAEVIYICPRSDTEAEKGDSQTNVDELLERIESLETSLQLVDLGSKNWILFDVTADTDKKVSWAEGENEDLWSIVNSNMAGKELKLLYNQNIVTDNSNDSSTELQYTTGKCSAIYSRNIASDSYKLKWDLSKVQYIDTSKNSFSTSDSKTLSADYIAYYNNMYYRIYKMNSGKKCYYNSKTFSLNSSSFYKKDSSYENKFVKWENDTTWNYKEMKLNTYETSGSYKKILYDQINSNIRDDIVKKNYFYKYNSTNVFSSSVNLVLDTTATYSDKFGTIDQNDDLTDASFVGKNFWIGDFSYSRLSGTRVYTTYGYRYISNGTMGISNEYTWNESGTFNFKNDYSYTTDLYDDKTGYYLMTYNYIPVITIKFDSFLSFDQYPESYKTKYSGCTESDLGTKSCPRILKLSSTNLSWS